MQGEQKRILLFEEEFESMRDLKEHIEEELGWYVELTAEKSILERLGRQRFDLIVVDLMIRPTSLDADDKEVENVHYDDVNWRKTGLEFLRRLRRGEYSQKAGLGTSPAVPIIVLSAVAGYSVKNELGEGISVDDYVEKPFRLEEMIERMRRLLKE